MVASRRADRGFSLPEVLVAIGLIVVALSGLAVVMGAVATNHLRTTQAQAAETLLSDEAAFVRAVPFDDIIQQASITDTAPEPCNVSNSTGSTVLAVPTIDPVDTVSRDGTTFTISRNVRWFTDPSIDVTCAPGTPPTLEAIDDVKVVLLTATWSDPSGVTRTRTISVYATPHSMQGIPAEALP